jgi:copper(I)-binding protein
MQTALLVRLIALLALTPILPAPILPALAQDYTLGKIKISQVWTRVPPSGSKVAGGFMTITNIGAEADTLVGGSALISHRFEVHEMAVVDGVMRMRELTPGLVIKPGETITLKPGSYHVMFMDLAAPIETGKPFKGTLVFEKAGNIEVEYKIEPFGTRVPGDGGQPLPADGTAHGGHK